jgi:4-carboxymuconolactone decarboxylase
MGQFQSSSSMIAGSVAPASPGLPQPAIEPQAVVPNPHGHAEQGKAVVAEMLGQPFLERLSAMAASDQFGAANAALALEFAFGAVWARDGLSRQQRSLVTMGLLIGSGKFAELKNHVRAALRNGLGPKELQEVVLQAAPYCGFPACAEATETVVAVLREAGLLGDSSNTGRDYGLR